MKKLETYHMDKRDGLEQYFKEGWMTSQKFYAMGKLNGVKTSYILTDDDGWVLAEMEVFKDGNQHGPYMSTWNGVLNGEGFYRDNKREGQYKNHDKNQDGGVRLSKVVTYANGEIVGPYAKFGRFLSEVGLYIVVEKDGTRFAERRQGAWLKFNSETGLLIEAFTYEQGEKVGPYAQYSDKGTLEVSGTYGEGRNKTFKWYKKGKLVETGQMVDGKLTTQKVQ